VDRKEYTDCMTPFMKGKGKTKQQRQHDMCIGAKLCSGKASSETDAEVLCNAPKLPKWAKGAAKQAEEEPISCPDRIARIRNNLEAIALKVTVGEAEEVKEVGAQVLVDAHKCLDDAVINQATEAMNELKELAGRHYLKAESRELNQKINHLMEVLP